MPPFAPKLTSDIGYTQPLAAKHVASAGPTVLGGIGDVFSGALDTVEKAFDANKPKAPSYQQLKDEDELRNFNMLQTGAEKAAQLRAQGRTRAATDTENQVVLDFTRAGGDPNKEAVKYMFERVTGRSSERFGLSAEAHAHMKITESEIYANAFVGTYGRLPLNASNEERNSVAMTHTMNVMAANSTIAAAEAKTKVQAAENGANWAGPGGLLMAFTQKIHQFANGESGAAMLADQAGRDLDPTSLANSRLRFKQFEGTILSQKPDGVSDTQWSNVTAQLTAINTVYDGLIKKGETLKAAHASALVGAVLLTPDISPVVKHVIINTDDYRTFGFTGKDFNAAFKALKHLDRPLWKIGDGNPRNFSSGAPGFNRDNEENPQGTIPLEVLAAYNKGNPQEHVEDMNVASKYFSALNSKAAGQETQTVANISEKMAASVHNSPVPFAAADIKYAYNTGLISTIKEVGKTDPRTAWAMSRQHLEALNNMSTKAYQNARRTFGDSAILGVDGIVRLDWDRAFDKFPNRDGFRETIKGHMKTALELFGGDFYAFTKAYRRSKQGRSVDVNYSEGPRGQAVSLFMNSQDMSKFMQEGGELEEQMNSLVAINAARRLMKGEADRIKKTYLTAVDVGDEFTQDVTSDAIPEEVKEVNDRLQGATTLDEIRALGEQQRDTMSSILDAPPFPRERPREGVVDKVGEALGDAASYIMNVLIPPAAAGTLPNAVAAAESNNNLNAINRGTFPLGHKDYGKIIGSDLNASRSVTRDGSVLTVPVSELTIKELQDFQKITDPNDTNRIFVAGKYQINPGTMKMFLAAHPEVKKTDLFDEALQDKAFKYLITVKREDIGRYISGKSDDKNAALLALAKEWAAFPVPYDMPVHRNGKDVSIKKGESYYAAGNKARVSVKDAEDALDSMRSGSQPAPVPVPRQRPSGIDDELPENQIMDTVLQTVPDATPEEVKEAIDRLQGTITLDEISALGARQKAIMSSILDAPPVPRERPVSEEEQQQPTFAPKLTSDTGYTQDSYLYRPTPTPMGP